MAAMAVLAPRGQGIAPRQGLSMKAARKLFLLGLVALAAIGRRHRRLMRKFAAGKISMA
jgi:hypothetical protein